ncbi:TonB-dependent receptor [Fulvivirga lutea]|uniref:Carboxypeptidase regulatory-like domain-containing protein n=1 Tax=Fulvivirga lutea TaxID=2810512 RepID=A0A974WN97_9BACT|nr:TonB-dependent receptor [Fulvivirga lutea]QSE98598.1 carboxypeptidase regulatory-like domain-containing protein [Fulvivirga lutea]
MKQILHRLLVIPFLIGVSFVAYSQGVTSSSMNGRVTDNSGEPLPGANIVAVHTPSGTTYGTISNIDGYYTLANMRTGGPYKVTVSFVGYDTQVIEGINLVLGEKRNLNFTLNDNAETLAEVVITAQTDEVINSGRTGAATNVSTETINQNPSINRSIEDFVRLTPQAASGVGNGGVSIAGSNSRYNNITIDGAVNNDAFGLNSDGLPGSSSGAEPISLDAIEEISILVAPYDVTKGSFTGGGINAVTRSGTNDIEGSAYYFVRNENLAGKTIGDDPQKQSPFFNRQYGARIGGPIIKDKLFYFVNVEREVAETPNQIRLVSQSELDAFGGDVPANVSNISIEDAQSVRNYLQNNFGYDPGGFGSLVPERQNTKIFGKLDYNINKDHQISFRHSYLKATDENISRSQNSLEFENNGYLNDVVSNSSILELRSRLSDNASNNLIIGYTSINRERNLDDYGPLFPMVEIDTDNGTTLIAGSQRSSVGNELRQGIAQLTNNFTLFKNKHTFTFGTHNEMFDIFNSFVNRYPGHYEYDGLDNFLNNDLGPNGRFRVRYSLDYFNDRFQPVDLRFLQTGWYVQDEFQATEKLRLTAGLRVDIPLFLDEPNANPLFAQEFGRNVQDVPSGQLLWSPRFGFNYDVNGDQSLQVRGGLGIFTGRVPFVWISNAYTNSGATTSLVDVRINRGGDNVPLYPDGNRTYEYFIADQLGVDVNDPAVRQEIESRQSNAPTSQIDVLDEDLKLPQNFRMNLAVDTKLPWGLTATFEAIYSKTINAIQYQNLQLGTPDGSIPTEAGRPTFSNNQINDNFRDVFLLTNTNEGHQYSFTGQLNKSWSNNLSAMLAYTYGVSKDANGGTHTTANSGWEFNPTPGNPNTVDLSYSVWDLRHRIVGNVNYRKEYANFAATSIGVFFSAQSGSPFTFMVNGDLNGDGSFGNDQAYIPRDQSEILFGSGGVPADAATQAQQWAELNAFIERDDYLKENRGKIAERNGARTPWTALIDLRLMQEFKVLDKNRLQFTMDIENVANFLNNEWGRQYDVRFNTYNLLQFTGFDSASGRPVYNYSDRPEAWTINNAPSIWRMQLGVRYIFGN